MLWFQQHEDINQISKYRFTNNKTKPQSFLREGNETIFWFCYMQMLWGWEGIRGLCVNRETLSFTPQA